MPTEEKRGFPTLVSGSGERFPAVAYLDGVGPNDHMIDVSPGVADLLGIPREDWVERFLPWVDVVHPEDLDRVVAACNHSDATGDPFRVEYRAIHPDGRELWIREDAVLITDDSGAPAYWLGLMVDVTEMMQAQERVFEAESRFGALVEQIPAIVYVDIADEAMTTSYVSPQIESLLGITPAEYMADPQLWMKHLHPEDRERALDTYLRGRESGEPFSFEYRLIARNGREVWFSDSAVVRKDAEGRAALVQGVMLDISARKEAEARIAFLAYHDKLTGLSNKAMFDELLDLALARARRHDLGVAVLSLDVDDFKLVNDSLGHVAGDELITQLADRLRMATRETDLVARHSGDEFLMLLSDLDQSPALGGGPDSSFIVAETVAAQIQSAMREPFDLDGTEIYITASVGISMYPSDAADGQSLLKNAETAMFRSKDIGPGGYLMHSSDDPDVLSRLSLSTRLRKAVENESWMLHYQPLVDLDTGKMVGVEALIRWPDPNGGLVPPGEFIPLAEEMGLIEAIGDWVVEEIGRQDTAWRAEGLVTDISFNLSPRQLWQPDLLERITGRLAAADLPPDRVTVEITESSAMTDPDRTQSILEMLHDRGFRLAIDDFGTGYSSLARLKHLPVDVLKIDRSFIQGVESDKDAASMVSAMIALASNLGISACAEGIETDREWRFLADRGCELGQGFLFARPMPAEDILAIDRRSGFRVLDGATG